MDHTHTIYTSLQTDNRTNTSSSLNLWGKKVKVAHTRLPSVGFRSWSSTAEVSAITDKVYLRTDCYSVGKFQVYRFVWDPLHR